MTTSALQTKAGCPVDDELADFVRARYPQLLRRAYLMTGSQLAAEDLVQEAYARALARPKVFLDVADPEAWLRTVAVNLARTRWRRRRLLDTMVRTGRIEVAPESVPGASPDRARSPRRRCASPARRRSARRRGDPAGFAG